MNNEQYKALRVHLDKKLFMLVTRLGSRKFIKNCSTLPASGNLDSYGIIIKRRTSEYCLGVDANCNAIHRIWYIKRERWMSCSLDEMLVTDIVDKIIDAALYE